MPNSFAYLMLIIWPLVCLILFRRLTVERAIIWSILGGYLLLPVRAVFDLPLVPNFDKTTIPNLSALAFCLLIARKRLSLWPESRVMRLVMVIFVLGTIPTVLTNSDPIRFSPILDSAPISFDAGQLPGLRWLDILSVMSGRMIVLIPFVLGRAFLASRSGQRELLLALVVGGLAYSLPALVEIRLSPQLNIWIYGFFQHDFSHMMRDGGFRPLVFLVHALWLAFFMMTASVAAAALAREAHGTARGRYLAAVLYLLVVLVLSKSLAPLLYALSLVPLVLLAGPRLQIRLALALALLATLYPLLRENGLVPLDAILDWAAAIGPDRAHSLAYRFGNEEQLLARAQEKILFGWGGWARNLVHDPQSGAITTIPDGEWIIVFGTFGMLGYITLMGLLAGPLVMVWRRARRVLPSRTSAALALILAITLIDMLINAILTPYTWLIAGALIGACEDRAGLPAEPRRGRLRASSRASTRATRRESPARRRASASGIVSV